MEQLITEVSGKVEQVLRKVEQKRENLYSIEREKYNKNDQGIIATEEFRAKAGKQQSWRKHE